MTAKDLEGTTHVRTKSNDDNNGDDNNAVVASFAEPAVNISP